MKLSIIIPVYNEEATVKEILARVKKTKLPTGVKKEIVVVDDGSDDNSKFEVQNAKLQFGIKNLKLFEHKKNKGKGAAIRTGIKKATGDVILIQDADLEYNPSSYTSLLAPILKGGAKVVYGTRLKNYPVTFFGKKQTPFISHYLGNRLLSLVTSILYQSKVSDMETCYKVFKNEVLAGVRINADKFDFEPEITAKILKRGYKIHEVPIKVEPRGYEDGKKITWRDGFSALWALVKYRFTD